MSTSTAAFTRPVDWPSGHLADAGIQCPGCGGHDAISVQATTWVHLTEDGSEDGEHVYGADSHAACGDCRWTGTFGDCSMLPTPPLPLSHLWIEWNTPQSGPGTARWGSDRFPDTATSVQAYELVAHFWPGVTITASEGGVVAACVADSIVDTLSDALVALLGVPDTIA